MAKDKKEAIEQYDHRDKTRMNNPPVGQVMPETDKGTGKTTYSCDPHVDPQHVSAGKVGHTASSIEFDTAFQALTDNRPLQWQRRLFDQLRSGEIPQICDLPTGLGKTSVIPIWTIALAWQAQERPVLLPRRLLYVVNRRTVVDQATAVVEQIRQRLLAPNDPRWANYEQALRALARALGTLASTEELVLAVSTLRGELADNEEWKADPARPAIIIGTVDMIGSKLLFSGYGDGRYWRSQHAGLVGQDSLIVHDEAHLTPAFSDLLRQLTEVQRRAEEPKPVHVLELSATSRGGKGTILKLEPEDEKDKVVQERLNAAKRVRLQEVEINAQDSPRNVIKKTVERLVDLSLKHKDAQAKVLIYVRSPEAAQEVLRSLNIRLGHETSEARVALLTGTIRGHERDQLVRTNPVYRAFLQPDVHVDHTLYLVSTSAGEVGIDIDADHMVCDLSTLDSMIQRLGRVNRRGGRGRKAEVDVVVQTRRDTKNGPSEVEEAIEATQRILNEWATKSKGFIDTSPRSLRALLDGLDGGRREKAFAPKPLVPPLTDILLDAWSLTSVTHQMPGRPEVASYLHGLEDNVPETYVAWRKEVTFFHKAEVDEDTLGDWFQACPIEARERLRDRTDRLQRVLEDLLKEHRNKHKDRDFAVVLLNERGEAEWRHLTEVVDKGFRLAYRTLVLPVEAGGLNEHGALDPQQVGEASDVADKVGGATRGSQGRARWLLSEETGGPRYEPLVTGGSEILPKHWKERERVALEPAPEDTAEGERYLLLMTEPRQAALEQAETAKTRQTLDFHLALITDRMNRITESLGLDTNVGNALALAARWHDLGKNRPVWQQYACNPPSATPLAKSVKYLPGQALGGYRHEFGSMLEATASEEIRRHEEADLILHLIAAHHGWARPHFGGDAWDNSHTTAENEGAAAETMRRFARLQQRFGRWGLAWIESLVRCADIAASKPDAQPTDSHGEGVA